MARVKQNPQENYNKPLAMRLRELIEKKGLSMLQLAKEIGVSRQAINSYTLGESVPDAHNLAKLASYFDVTSDYLLGLSPTKRFETHGITALNLGFSEKAVDTLRWIQEVEPKIITLLNWIIELENPLDEIPEADVPYSGGLLSDLLRYFVVSETIDYSLFVSDNGDVSLSEKGKTSGCSPNTSIFYLGDLLSTSALRDIESTLKRMHIQFETDRDKINEETLALAKRLADYDASQLTKIASLSNAEKDKIADQFYTVRKQGEI